MRNLLFTAVLVLPLAACQTTSFQKPIQGQDYGSEPSYSESDLKTVMGEDLRDPDSAKYKFLSPEKAYCNNGILSGGKIVWTGWVVPVEQNAKNSYGAYVGYQKYYARFENGVLLDISDATNPNVHTWYFSPKLGTGCSLLVSVVI